MTTAPLDLDALDTAWRRQRAGAHQRPSATLHANDLRTLALAACLPDQPDEVRERAVSVLAWFEEDPAVMRLLLDLCADPCPTIRWLASAVHWGATPAVRESILREFERRDDAWGRPLDTIGPLLETIDACGAPVMAAFWFGISELDDERMSPFKDRGGWDDIVQRFAGIAATPESLEWWMRIGSWNFFLLFNQWGRRRDPMLRCFVMRVLESIENFGFNPAFLTSDVSPLLLEWGHVDALPVVRRWVQSIDDPNNQPEQAPEMTDLLDKLEALVVDRTPRPPLLDGPLAPWTCPPSTVLVDGPRVEGWVWFIDHDEDARARIEATPRPAGWDDASIAGTMRGLRVFWPHPDMTRSMERALAWCDEEIDAEYLLEHAPTVPFLVDGEVAPVWIAWTLSQLRTHLTDTSTREHERWLTWLMFTLHAPHTVLAQRYADEDGAEAVTSGDDGEPRVDVWDPDDDDIDEFGEVDVEHYPIPSGLLDIWDDDPSEQLE